MSGQAAATADYAAAGSDDGLVVFTARQQRFALRMTHVREILRLDRITPVYRAEPFICGVANLRGQVVAVCDLIAFLGLGAIDRQERGMQAIALVGGGRDLLALIEVVPEVLWAGREFYQPPPATLPESVRGYIEAVIQQPGQAPVALLDVERLLQDERWTRYRA